MKGATAGFKAFVHHGAACGPATQECGDPHLPDGPTPWTPAPAARRHRPSPIHERPQGVRTLDFASDHFMWAADPRRLDATLLHCPFIAAARRPGRRGWIGISGWATDLRQAFINSSICSVFGSLVMRPAKSMPCLRNDLSHRVHLFRTAAAGDRQGSIISFFDRFPYLFYRTSLLLL